MNVEKIKRLQRAIRFVVYTSNPDVHRTVVNSIRYYRYVTNKVFSTILAVEMLGASVEVNEGSNLKIVPRTDRAKELLSIIFNKVGKAAFYEVREYVLNHMAPDWHSFVFDGMRRELWSRWQARDPVHEASHGYLVLNGVRNPTIFRNAGIGFHSSTTKFAFDGHAISLKWDHKVGSVEFRTKKLSGGQYYIWRMLRSGAWHIQNLMLSERSNEISLTFNYYQPCNIDVLPEDLRVVKLKIVDSAFQIADASRSLVDQKIDTIAAISWLSRLKIQSSERSKSLSSVGNASSRIGNSLHRKLRTLTERRKKGCKTWNHVWTKRIIHICSNLDVGRIDFEYPTKAELGGHPWSWSEFLAQLSYKADAAGIAVQKHDPAQKDSSGAPSASSRV